MTCEAIICQPCRSKFRFTLPKKGCPFCNDNPNFHMLRLKNKLALKLLSSVYETHNYCDRNLRLNHSHMVKHLEQECTLNRRCAACQKDFDSLHDYKYHLKYSCPSVRLQCSDCNIWLLRSHFIQHDCYKNKNYDRLDLV